MVERTRGYAHRVDLRASPEVVWEALTDASQAVQWHASEVQIDARMGGRYWISTPDGTGRDAHIDVFEAPRRLRLIYLPAAGLPSGDAVLVEDYLIAGVRDATVLRLLGSGVPHDRAWDTFFLQLRAGQELALRRFKLFLERQPAVRGA